jgi:hypothetical protein
MKEALKEEKEKKPREGNDFDKKGFAENEPEGRELR